jgi:hypothetical protein
MQAKEFLREFSEQSQYSNLVSVLNFLKNSADKRGLTPKISTASLINMVKNTGQSEFEYGDLVKANEQDSTVKNLIKSFNKDEVIVSGDNNQTVTNSPDSYAGAAQNPEQTVSSMAKKALNRRH